MGATLFSPVLLYCISHCLPTLPLFGGPPWGEHSSIPIGAPLPGLGAPLPWLVPLYFIPLSWPTPTFLALLHQSERSTIPIGAPQHRFGTLLFHSVLLQHSTSHLAILVSLVAGPLCYPNWLYCLSNPHVDSQVATISLHLCYISRSELNDIGIQFQPLARYKKSANTWSTSSFFVPLMNYIFLLSLALMKWDK